MAVSKSSTSIWAKLLAAVAVAVTGVSAIQDTYDYVVVGGGLSGLVVANRLSENRRVSVLVIEAGPLDAADNQVLVPSNAVQLGGGRYMFNVSSVPQPGLDNRTGAVFSAKVVGGGSVVNGMFFDRGSKADYDAWARFGNPGWDWRGLLPYFKKSETFTPPDKALAEEFNITYTPSGHGYSGPIHASFPAFVWPSVKNFFRAATSIGITKAADGQNGDAVGVFWNPSSSHGRNHSRSYARPGYYETAKDRPNYTLLPNTSVTKLLFTGNRVTGVQYTSGPGAPLQTVRVRREAILATGALHTPQILQLSGIGPRALLSKFKIPVKVDLPGVGSNLQDHISTILGFFYTTDITPNPSFMQNATYAAEAWDLYVNERKGPHTISTGNAVAFISYPQASPRWESVVASYRNQTAAEFLPAGTHADIIAGYALQRRVLIDLYSSRNAAVLELPFGGSSFFSVVSQHPLSRGTILINSTDVFTQPLVDYRVLTNPIDLTVLIDILRYSRQIINAPPIGQELGAIEFIPGPNVQDDETLGPAIRSTLTPSIAHMCCTAPMLPRRSGGVVDSELKVYGVANLRIVDASVWPLIPATHTQSSTYATAEKAADIIKSSL